jgi:hypothetical protein
MISIALVGYAFSACTLSATVDPNSKCVEDTNGFSTLDADSDGDIPISLVISTKGETIDAFSVTHPATSSTLSDELTANGRYILACPQVAGKKTVRMTITRPADLTAFGGEWVQLFPKDSWSNVTNEYEPFTFNNFGAKIPLQEFRATTTGLLDDAPNVGTLDVFMEVSDEGDYEVKYGNPSLMSNDKWVAVEFKSTLLRVGAPWADCTASSLDTFSYSVGSIMPVLYGHPNLHSIALKSGFPSYDDVVTELTGVTVPVKVVLEIFNAGTTSYTSSSVDGQCYKAGNSCPEAHAMCKAEYCEMDVWAQIIADLKGASPGKVTVLGSIDSSTSTSAYDDLDVDGYYVLGADGSSSSTYTAVFTIYDGSSSPHLINGVPRDVANSQSGTYEVEFTGTELTIVDQGSDDWCYLLTVCDQAVPLSNDWAGYACTSSDTTPSRTIDVTPYCGGPATDKVTVSAIGAPLFDESKVDDATVYVTLASSDIGIWNPFSWYPYVSPSKWAAIVTDATNQAAVAELFDRGYGWVYLTSESGFDTASTMNTAVLDAIEGTSTTRRLQERGLEASEPYWGCDDTLFECKPICVKKTGVVATKVSDTLCAGAPMDQCSCKCFHDAQWTCEGNAVVC